MFRLVLIIVIFSSCKLNTEQSSALSVVPHHELLLKAISQEIPLALLPYKGAEGGDLSDAERARLNSGKATREFYQDVDGNIKEIRLSTSTEENIFKEIQIREMLSNPFSSIELIDVDCSARDSLILDAFRSDQDVRRGGEGDMMSIDQANQQLVISLLQKCNWSSDAEVIRASWFIIQHADSGFMAYYFDRYQKSVDQGLLSPGTMALMEDRLLMNHGFPQIYGSQVVQNSLYQMTDPANINQRRESVGLGTIEEYTERFGFEFRLEDYLD